MQNQLNDAQQKLSEANNKNSDLQKQLDNALQDAKDTEAYAQSVLNAHQ
ncbi:MULTISPECIES: hypothetical protein [Leuconostoc]|nr:MULTISPECIES: hypothetical protein [Leuconostoc]KDA48625.1 hypothetical protein L964_1854 [Leuconostoc pseudomesenteroides 1159]KDA49938.1 hypothetical protein L965_642 [Leuconostoc pseudomesenteroides PS12]MDG9745480.1 hypothetical protein [Leuconostoc falkenbergense]CCJ65770.1 hypothetical protein Q5C_05275 [Leuconostoc pseudomesenteroides 4882]